MNFPHSRTLHKQQIYPQLAIQMQVVWTCLPICVIIVNFHQHISSGTWLPIAKALHEPN